MHADAGYTGVDKPAEITRAQQEGDIRKDVKWPVATKRGFIKAMREGPLKPLTALVERKKAQIRALVEHPFHVIKNLFGYKKVSYRGLRKNGVRLYASSPWPTSCWSSAHYWMNGARALVRPEYAKGAELP